MFLRSNILYKVFFNFAFINFGITKFETDEKRFVAVEQAVIVKATITDKIAIAKICAANFLSTFEFEF